MNSVHFQQYIKAIHSKVAEIMENEATNLNLATGVNGSKPFLL